MLYLLLHLHHDLSPASTTPVAEVTVLWNVTSSPDNDERARGHLVNASVNDDLGVRSRVMTRGGRFGGGSTAPNRTVQVLRVQVSEQL